MKARIEIQPVQKTHGQFLYRPACPVTKALAQSTVRKKNVQLRQIQALLNEGVIVEYIGATCPPLDKIGAKHIEAPKEQK